MIKAAFVCLLFLTGFCSNSFSQTVYHIRFSFGDSTQGVNEAFLVRYEDGTGFIRATDPFAKDVVVEMEFEELYYIDSLGNIDSNILVIEGFDTKVIRGNSESDYPPLSFWFDKDVETGYFEPATVTSLSIEGTDSTLIFGDFTANLITEEELTEDFVLHFFNKDDDFYQNLFTAVTRVLTTEEKKTRMHLLIVANTEDEKIGSTCLKDKDRMEKTFTDLAEYLGIQLSTKIVYGKEYSKANVEAAITSIKPNPKDIVVFYYTGHGFSKTDNYQFPHLELRSKAYQSLEGNSLNMEEIFNNIKRKGALLNLVISDCCNTEVGAINTISGEHAVTKSSSLGWSLETCKALFLPPKPVSILMTAAAKGEMSAGNNDYGGFFTYHLRASLENYLSPFYQQSDITWAKIIEEAKKQTITKANRTWCLTPDAPKAKCVQHPVYKIQ
ncbi:MAG: caspase family protein [Chitinophagaceae bacterium]|nr:caspase family protein [Chitinophagaceae bacterium]